MTKSFDKLLIANRGEIACRVARTARRMGLRSVAVYSAADRRARHVGLCDEGFFIGESPAAESYLNMQRIISAARETGAGAIHPGYGFLSENPEFAEACADAGIIFVGPSPEAIRAMGDKSRAKDVMAEAGVPVLAGYQGAKQSAAILREAATAAGYPVLIKAAAGGGGKGMRLVESDADFDAALAAVKREADAAFGDARVLIEKYLPRARHVEVQVFADAHGHTIHLFERDCSIQRRHQKVIEEAPAPGVDAELREALGAAAVRAAQSIGYVGAGTVEFLLAPDKQFYFMEMNTRLQVEHPVTEMITGFDLVEWQLLVAAGAPLPISADAESATAPCTPFIQGHAMEARIYAENPDNDFLPATGALEVYRHLPERAWRRVDSGVAEGESVSTHYDPMLAKLIVWGRDRETARKRLRAALAGFDIAGVVTNLGFLHRLTGLEDFITPELDTALIERNRSVLFGDDDDMPESFLVIASLFEIELAVTAAANESHSPWAASAPWRLNLPGEATFVFTNDATCTVHFHQDQPFANINGEQQPVSLTPLPDRPGWFQFRHGERTQTVSVYKANNVIHINAAGERRTLAVADDSDGGGAHADSTAAGLTATMPGAVVEVAVKENQRVCRGAPLLLLEAMKMEHTISAPYDGVVKKIFFARGDQVREGDQLLSLEAETPKD